MIGRADIEGSKSDVAMNAWPPQASSLLPTRYNQLQNRLALRFLANAASRRSTLSGGSSPYLKQEASLPVSREESPTNTLASVEPPSPCTFTGEYGQVSCGLSLSSGFLAVRQDYWEALLPQLATTGLARVPRIQVFCLHSTYFYLLLRNSKCCQLCYQTVTCLSVIEGMPD